MKLPASTKALTDELTNRRGVEKLTIEPYEKITLATANDKREIEGPVILFIVTD